MIRPFRRLAAVMRGNPVGHAGRYIDSLDLGLTPYLADSHGPDGGQDTYDEVCADFGMDPLALTAATNEQHAEGAWGVAQ